jgi:hypothetical protein
MRLDAGAPAERIGREKTGDHASQNRTGAQSNDGANQAVLLEDYWLQPSDNFRSMAGYL